MVTIHLKRIYDLPSEKDGTRILVDRLWPRGISKEKAQLDYWLKEIGPSNELRKTFHHGDLSFEDFKERYLIELQTGEQKEAFDRLRAIVVEKESVTLLFSAKDEEANQAVLLREKLEVS